MSTVAGDGKSKHRRQECDCYEGEACRRHATNAFVLLLTCYVNARRTNYLSTTLESSTNENDFNYHLQHLSPCFVMPGALAVGFVLGRRLQLGRRFLSRGYKLHSTPAVNSHWDLSRLDWLCWLSLVPSVDHFLSQLPEKMRGERGLFDDTLCLRDRLTPSRREDIAQKC